MELNRCWNIQKGLLGKHFQFTSAVSGSRSHQLGKPSQEEWMWDFLGGKKMEDLVSVIGPESFRSSLTKGLIDLSQYWVWQLDCEKINLDETRPCQAATAISYVSFGISLIWIRFCPNKDRLFWSRCLGCSHQGTIHNVWLSAVLRALFLLRKACGELLVREKKIDLPPDLIHDILCEYLPCVGSSGGNFNCLHTIWRQTTTWRLDSWKDWIRCHMLVTRPKVSLLS